MRVRSVAVFLALGLMAFGCAGSKSNQSAAPVVEAGSAAPSPPEESSPPTAPPRDPVVGDTVPVGRGGSLTVRGFEADVNAGALFPAPKGQRYFAAEVEGCAGRTEAGLSFEPEYFVLRLADNGVAVAGLGVKKPDLLGGTLPSDDCLAGWVTFTIPDKAQATAVAYNGASRVEWRIPPS